MRSPVLALETTFSSKYCTVIPCISIFSVIFILKLNKISFSLCNDNNNNNLTIELLK